MVDNSDTQTPNDGATRLSLLMGVRQRDPRARESLYRVYSPLVRVYCLRIGFSTAEVDDAVHDVFTVVLEKVDEFERERTGSFRAWLRKIALNKWHEHLRQGPRGIGGTDIHLVLENQPTPPESDPIDMREVFLRAVDELRNNTRISSTSLDAFILFAIDKLPSEEVAQRLSMRVGTVNTAVCRVRDRLKEYYGVLLDLEG